MLIFEAIDFGGIIGKVVCWQLLVAIIPWSTLKSSRSEMHENIRAEIEVYGRIGQYGSWTTKTNC